MQQQVAPQFASATEAISAPLKPIPDYRVRQFSIGVGERLREGAAQGLSEAQVLGAIQAERLALAQALNSEAFRAAFAQEYFTQYNALSPAAPLSAQACRAATDDIVAHRINDARTLAQLVTQPDFISAAHTAAPKPQGTYHLPQEKIDEMVERFAEDTSPLGTDGVTHAQQAMIGHRIGHLALAKVYDENGPLRAVLERELSAHLSTDVAIRAATDWLQARRNPAIATAEVLAEGGIAYQAVLERIARATTKAPAAALPASALGLSQNLVSTTALSPAELERRKTREQRAADVAYTINHALSCGATDILFQTPISEAVARQGKKGGRWASVFHFIDRFFEKHHDGPRATAAQAYAHQHKHNGLWHWLEGEAVGDIAAIPLTIGVQRFFPGFMHGLRKVLEPVAGWAFARGAKRDARHWAREHGFAPGSVEEKAKEHALYEHEISHLPQAVMWNVFSIPINLFTQKKILHSPYSWGQLIVGKTFGSLFSNGVLIGTRAIAPEMVHKWDNFNSRHFITPVNKAVGSVFGVDSRTMEQAGRNHVRFEGSGWQGRLQEPAPQVTASTLR